MSYRAADRSSQLGNVPIGTVEWRLETKTLPRILLSHQTAQTAFEAYRKAALAEPFSEVICTQVRK